MTTLQRYIRFALSAFLILGVVSATYASDQVSEAHESVPHISALDSEKSPEPMLSSPKGENILTRISSGFFLEGDGPYSLDDSLIASIATGDCRQLKRSNYSSNFQVAMCPGLMLFEMPSTYRDFFAVHSEQYFVFKMTLFY